MLSFTKQQLQEIKNNPHRQIFNNLAYNYIFTEDFIRSYKSFFNDYTWMYISQYQELSEPFMEEFQNDIWWYQISGYQNLSINFIIKFYDRLSFRNLMLNYKISNETKEFIKTFI